MLFRLTPSVARRRSAFTLIELLVSMTVMTLLIVLVTQLLNSATNVTTASTKRLDADTQSRIVFTRMAYDFAGMVKRPDVDCFFVKNAGGASKGANDAMYFYSESPGYFSNDNLIHSPVSFIGYRIANRKLIPADPLYPDNIMERVSAGLNYDGGGTSGNTALMTRNNMVFLTYTPAVGTAAPVLNRESTIPRSKGFAVGTQPTWDNASISSDRTSTSNYNFSFPLSDSIFRLEFCFLAKDPNKLSNSTGLPFVVPVAPGSSPWTLETFMTHTYAKGEGNISMRQIPTDAAAVVVSIAALDPRTRVLLNATQMNTLRDSLVDGDDNTVIKKWTDAINSTTYRTTTNLPPAVIAQIHVYQRFFYLNTK